MGNILPNGTVLPSGLLGSRGHEANIVAFNQSYRNTGIKAGFVQKIYSVNDPENKSKLSTEYDVLTIEQFENKGTTSILYKNCLSNQGFGSIADFFEYNLRSQTYNTNKGFPTFSSQDGAVVLIQCLGNIGDKAIVVGNLGHPDRGTTVGSDVPYLRGEYNGINVEIDTDGSATFTFRGATNSKGVPTDSSQGDTVASIGPDGSFQIQHSTITFRMDRTSGIATWKANQDINLTANNNINIVAKKQANISCSNLNVNASDSIDISCNGPTSINSTGNIDVTSQGDVTITAKGRSNINTSAATVINSVGMLTIQSATEIDILAPLVKINTGAGQVLTTVTDPVIDLLLGVPTVGLPDFLAG